MLPAPRDSGMGHVALSIPEYDYFILQIRFPELASRDAGVRLAAWKRFIASPLSEPYRVHRNEGKKRPGFAAGTVRTAHARLDTLSSMGR